MPQALCSQVVSSCPVWGLAELAEEYCLLECKSQAEGALTVWVLDRLVFM